MFLPVLTSLSLISFFVTPIAQAYPRYYPIHRSCGASDPSANLTATHEYLVTNEPLDNDLANSTTISERHATALTRRQLPGPLYTVDTYFHIVSSTADSSPSSTKYVTDAMALNQFNYLLSSYANYSISYTLKSTTRTINDTWAANGDDGAMKTALRQGTYRSLNVYFQTELEANANTPGIPAGETLLGFCSLPSAGITSNSAPSVYVLDGCNILSGTMPGGIYAGYNQGGTCVHEVGHWNGLLHPFQDNTCSSSNFGDYVADTPQQSLATTGCPASQDSCASSGVAAGWVGAAGQGPDPYGPSGYSGNDSIHNFMDYSDDACYTGFTAGHAARMVNLWGFYRQGL